MQLDTVEKALAKERELINFNPRKLSEFLYGAELYAQVRENLERFPEIPCDFNLHNKGRVEVIKKAMRDSHYVYEFIKGRQLIDPIWISVILNFPHQVPGSVHLGMFIKCIEIMGTEEQQKQYIEKCHNFQIVGCYAQTEMAHGSDVSSLMTTATFDEKNDQFIMNTPDIRACKFWPGDLGLIATHALVFAKLIIKGKSHGIHSFIVEIRDKDMRPKPGVEVGDIGPKIGFFSKDNGYLILSNVRVPRKNMLRKYISVSEKGEMKIKGNPKISYATMMDIRRHISISYPKIYCQAITIATRYSIFRRQFKNAAKEEIKIMDYQLQQEKIIERVAEYYAIHLAGNQIKKICDLNTKTVVQKEDFTYMAEAHACLCLGKPFFSETVYEGMEICRKACGGHGFSHYSGFPWLINQYACHLTHEGENTVLYLQVARYLLKCLKHYKMKKRAIGESVKYIESIDYLLAQVCEVDDVSKWTLQNLRVLMAQSVCYLLGVVTEKLLNKEQDFSDKDVWNKVVGIRLREMAIMHAGYFTFNSFREAVILQGDERVKQITNSLCLLYGTNFLLSHANPIIEGKFISSQQIRSLSDLKEILLARIRPDLIGIVDGFGLTEKCLRSALIHGNPYENYLKLARQNELNHTRLESVNVVRKIKDFMKNPNPAL